MDKPRDQQNLVKIIILWLKSRPRGNSVKGIWIWMYEEWVKNEETHVVTMCSQQTTTGVFNRRCLDVISPTSLSLNGLL